MEMLAFKKKIGYNKPPGKEGKANLLTSYFKGLMKRHRKVHKSKKPCKFPKD
jgi:hypothetical protein